MFSEATKANMSQDFQVWPKGKAIDSPPPAVFFTWLARVERAQKAIAELQKPVRHALKADNVHKKEAQVKEITDAYDAGDTKRVFKGLRALKAFKPKVLPMLQNEDGRMSTTKAEHNDRWARHFASLLDGSVMTWMDFHKGTGRHTMANTPVPSYDAELPCKRDLQEILAATKPYRAAGPGGIAPEILSIFAEPIAAILHPLLVKTLQAGRDPTTWKGGRFSPIPKSGRMVVSCAAYRGVFIEDHLAKTFHKHARCQALPYLEKFALTTQHGGIQSRGTDTASLRVHLAQEFLSKRHISHAIIFLDVSAAFDSTSRTVLFEGIPEKGVDPVLRQVGLPSHLIELLRDLHSNTWFTLQGHDKVVRFQNGTKQGDPLGDLMFNFAMAALVRELQEALSEAGLQFSLDMNSEGCMFREFDPQCSSQSVPLQDVSHMDGECIIVASEHPEAFSPGWKRCSRLYRTFMFGDSSC